MVATHALTLVDELTGETLALEPGAPVAEVIERRVVAADHPRADFRGRQLPYTLLGPDGRPLDPGMAVTEPRSVSLVGPEAAEVRARRDRWLADIEARGTATTSVSATTHLALIERTGSRLDDVARLRARLAAERSERPPPPPPRPAINARLAALAAVGLALIAAALGVWALSSDGGSDTAAPSPVDEPAAVEPGVEEPLRAVPRPPLTVQAGPVIEIDGAASGGVGCGYLEPLEIAVPFEGPVEVGCEIAVLVFAAPDGGGPVVITARSGVHDPILWLLDESGGQLAHNDDADGLNSRIEIELEPGEYMLEVGNLTGEPAALDVLIEVP